FCLPAARRPHRALHSFPTRRSSDLGIELGLDRSVIPYPDEDVTAAFTGQVVGHRADRLTDDVQVLDHPFELQGAGLLGSQFGGEDRKSTRLNSSHVSISYAVFCLKK